MYDPIKPLDPYGTVLNPADGKPVTTKYVKGGKKWNEMDAFGPNAERRHRGFAPCPGDLAHLPGNQPHHTVFTPSFLDIKKDERYTRTSSRIGKAYCTMSNRLGPCHHTAAVANAFCALVPLCARDGVGAVQQMQSRDRQC
eukprot:COSAG02_NODE_28594_length_586_cov_1.940452_1_plen_140_part_10